MIQFTINSFSNGNQAARTTRSKTQYKTVDTPFGATKRSKKAFSFGNGTEKDFERYCKDNHCKIISESDFYKEIHSLPFNEQITHIQFIREQLSLYNNL